MIGSLRCFLALFFAKALHEPFAATLGATAPAANGLLRRELEEPVEANPVQSVVVGSTGHGIITKSKLNEQEPLTKELLTKTIEGAATQKEVKLRPTQNFPFRADDLAFEFEVAPLRWARCRKGQTVQLSSSDSDWQACAARVQSEVGEKFCSRRRGNMIWPKNTEYYLDNTTQDYPCECCADSPYKHHSHSVTKQDAIWNVLWKKDCSNFTGENACGRSQPEDTHALDSAECEKGGACESTNNRWTCCDKRCHEIPAGQKGSCLSSNGGINKINEESFSGTGWGPPYRPSEAIASYAEVDSQACGSMGRRPAMPKTRNERALLVAAMKSWSADIGFVWIGLTKGQRVTDKWLWDDQSPLDPTILPGKEPWGLGEPSEHANQRGCIDVRNGTWHGCSFSVRLRIACESWT